MNKVFTRDNGPIPHDLRARRPAKPKGEHPQADAEGHPQVAPDSAGSLVDTLLIKASSPEAKAVRKQTPSYAEGSSPRRTVTHPGPTFRMGVRGHDHVPAGRGNAVGERT